jgi:hypothetical protein
MSTTEYTLQDINDGSFSINVPTLDRAKAFAHRDRLNEKGGSWVVVSRTTSDWEIV